MSAPSMLSVLVWELQVMYEAEAHDLKMIQTALDDLRTHDTQSAIAAAEIFKRLEYLERTNRSVARAVRVVREHAEAAFGPHAKAPFGHPEST